MRKLVLTILYCGVLCVTPPVASAGPLVGYWPFDDNVNDQAGTANGTFNGGPATYQKGQIGQALSFDGVNDYVDIPSPTNPAIYTVSAWVKPARTAAAGIITRTDASGPTTSWSHQLRINTAGQFHHYLWVGAEHHVSGTTATRHHLYFGGSSDTVTQGAASTDKGELTDPNFKPGTLDSLATYYWRVDELVVGGPVRTGPVSKFTTCRSIDDFESYTDQGGSEIFTAWIDGFTDGLSGSTVGHLTAANGTYGETRIVHGGKQSMPIDYNNVKSPFYSEVAQEFSPVQDWTAKGVDTLVLYVQGRAGNAPAPLYVVVEDNAKKAGVIAYADTAVVTTATWTRWKIPLSGLTGVNLAKVKKLSLGIGDKNKPVAGGTGRIFIDDISVTKP